MDQVQFTSTERIENFSDAVIAIIITIMVLEFRLPESALDQGLWLGVIKPIAPKVMSYALSFLVLTAMWVGHHAIMHSARDANPALMWCNNNLLFWMSMIPFATMILGDHPFKATAVALYAAALAFTASSFAFLRWLVMSQNEFRGEALLRYRMGQKRAITACLLYLCAIGTAFLSIYVSWLIYLFVPLMFFVWHIWLSRRLLHRSRKERT